MSKRIEYIDAMRGFTMLLVVIFHIETMSFQPFNIADISYSSFFRIFRMPLFFFICGYFFYRYDYSLRNIKLVLKYLLKKIRQQLMPTFIFLSLFIYLYDKPYLMVLKDPTKGGYWFTLSLFLFIVVFLFFTIIFDLFKVKDKQNTFLHILCSLLLFVGCSNAFAEYSGLDKDFIGFWGIPQFRYYIFFVVGCLLKKYNQRFQMFLTNNKLITLVTILFLSLAIWHNKSNYEFQIGILNHLLFIFLGIFGALFVWASFAKYSSYFSNKTIIGKHLQFIGSRTLDVYLLHFFFIPRNLDVITSLFVDNPNSIIGFTIILVLSIVIIYVCILVGYLLRLTPLLDKCIFGNE